jgi:hypothetical protein
MLPKFRAPISWPVFGSVLGDVRSLGAGKGTEREHICGCVSILKGSSFYKNIGKKHYAGSEKLLLILINRNVQLWYQLL